MMVLASILGMSFTTAGLWLSYWLNLTSGATIILVAGSTYLLSMAVRPLIRRVRPNQILKGGAGQRAHREAYLLPQIANKKSLSRRKSSKQ